MKNKRLRLNITCAVLAVAILAVVIWCVTHKINGNNKYEDDVEWVDPDTFLLKDSGVEVNFSKVILSQHNETRLLKVSEQNATISTKLTDKLIPGVDWSIFKKTQNISYTGTGSFVVDLNTIDESSLIDDKTNKILTIKIDHAHLDTLTVDPYKIIVDDVDIGLLNWGKISLTVKDYTAIEKEIKNRLSDEFNTVKNGQEADDIAKRMVKDTYEPIVKAIDKNYTVVVEFK